MNGIRIFSVEILGTILEGFGITDLEDTESVENKIDFLKENNINILKGFLEAAVLGSTFYNKGIRNFLAVEIRKLL